MPDSLLCLKRIVGTTCRSPTAFDTVNSSFAYTAGGAVVVVDVDGDRYAQRFYRARPTATPTWSVTVSQSSPSSTTPTPKPSDSRTRASLGRDSHTSSASESWTDPGGSRTWTSRERIKSATCLALSREGKYLAVGETGYAPRVLIFNLHDSSSDTPLVSISEHAVGVNAVAWSADTRFLASLGSANDGFIYVWKVDPRTGQTRLFQQNRCTSVIKDMVWMGNSLITLGVRHVKMWRIDDKDNASPNKSKSSLAETAPQASLSSSSAAASSSASSLSLSSSSSSANQKALSGRNILLGGLLDATFTCAAVDGRRMIFCTEAGDVCVLHDDDKQLKALKRVNLNFSISTITIRDNVAYVGGKDGDAFAILDVDKTVSGAEDCVIQVTQTGSGIVALGFLKDRLVTVNSRASVDVWNPDYIPGQNGKAKTHIQIAGHGEPVTGVYPLSQPNRLKASFLSWSTSGNVTFWDLDGQMTLSVMVPLEGLDDPDVEPEAMNQLTCARLARNGRLLVTTDRLGVLKVTDVVTQDCILDTKAHSSECSYLSLYEDESRFLMACCGRDRTVQLFHRNSNGNIEHFQTLEFSARLIQVHIPTADRIVTCAWDRTLYVHDLVARDGDPDVLAAVPSRRISLKASPTSMTISLDCRSAFVSMLDRTICQYDLATGRPMNTFKCIDEGGGESVACESLTTGNWEVRDIDFLLGVSNTDKSIRLYDSATGVFLNREWGHTEAISGVCFVDDHLGGKKVVSVALDGTIMIWTLDANDPTTRLLTRESSPTTSNVSGRPPLRKVFSKAELAEFQRLQQSPGGRRSPPRTVGSSRSNLSSSSMDVRTPTASASQTSPGNSVLVIEDTPSKRRSCETPQGGSPPASPRGKLRRQPSLPGLGHTTRRKNSSSNLRSASSLNTATEQACRTLRAYRKKLSSPEPITTEALSELDQELRFTAAALGDRAVRSRAMNETVLSGLLDQYSERLVTMLDEKLRLSGLAYHGRGSDRRRSRRRGSNDGSSTSTSLSTSTEALSST
ncbi:Mitogen-activated protein kinase-binding protein 1 [Escovopsis weberi]|uniref:Mitogen-activated protein kinase-binding protein 1 n=1 Tax=Escovopsis weberi TaxID=150374 RepID=A0A0M9VW55_ESCWE|nr:Mitogen-activated protein kinase-binding protein 1 [Escovopsis weberi]